MTQIEIDNVKQDLLVYIQDNPNLNNTKLAQIYLDENLDSRLSLRSIRRYISLIKEASLSLEEEIDLDANDANDGDTMSDVETPPLETTGTTFIAPQSDDFLPDFTEEEVDDNDAISFNYSGTTYEIDRREIDRIVCAYSRHGLNLAGPTVASILEIDTTTFRAIINKLQINKENKPYSSYSEELLEEKELYDELSENIDYLLDKLQENDNSVLTKLNKSYKKSVLLTQHSDVKFNAAVAELKDLLPKVTITPMRTASYSISEHLHLIIPDMHIGLFQSNYGIEIIRKQLAKLINYTEAADSVHVHFMGDIIHSVSGLNHKDSWKNMEPGVHGAEAIIQPYKLLLEFLAAIKNLKVVNIVGGNHDRLQSAKDQENTGEGAKLLAFMLDQSLVDIPVNFDSFRIVDDEDPDMTVILLHGDKPVDKESGQSIAWAYGNSNKFNYIATAHMHSRKQNPKDDGLRFRKEALPAFCPLDDYSKTVAHGSMPGIKLVSTDDDGLPITLDIPLHYEQV